MGGRCVVYLSSCSCRGLHVVEWVVGVYGRVVNVRSSHVPVVPEGKHMCFVVEVSLWCGGCAACRDAQGSVLCGL